MRYSTYDKYKKGTFFDALPAHWSEERLQDIAKIKTSNVDKKSKEDEDSVKLCNYLDVYKNSKIDSSIDFMESTASKLDIKRFKLNFDDVVITKDSEDPFDIGIPALIAEDIDNLVCGYHLTIIQSDQEKLLGSYLYYALEADRSKHQFTLAANGVTRFGLTQHGTKNIRICLPDLNEQKKIANFLDLKVQQIDQLIEKKKGLIEKLNEQRIAVVTQAVTKGLDKTAKMKPSGVDWLGDVPAHWGVLRAKFLASIFVPQRNKPVLNDSDGIPWITMDDMANDYIKSARLYVKEEHIEEASSKILRRGSVIASCVGNFGVASINCMNVVINQQLQAFVPEQINNEYLRYVVFASKPYFELIGTAATLVYVNQLGFENMPVPFPPSEEQNQVVNYLNREKCKFDEMLRMVYEAVDRLTEYRSAIITSVVTGKIDVRNIEIPRMEAA